MTINQPQSVPQGRARQDHNQTLRWSIVGAILLCTLILAILADSLLAVWQVELGQPISWSWLLGSPVQTFSTQTRALLLGVILLGIALGGVWFLLAAGFRWLRGQFF